MIVVPASTSSLPPLVIDLREKDIQCWEELWDELSFRCGLPRWFGRNLDAWWDTIQARNISSLVDAHFLIIRLPRAGLFGPGADGARFVDTTNESDYARVEFDG